MVKKQLYYNGIYNRRILSVMSRIPREDFLSEVFRKDAYKDLTLPIGNKQTISRPYIVAKMLQELDIKDEDKVLEIGTGSGYQTAIIAELCRKVITIEIFESLSNQARRRLNRLGINNVEFIIGNGINGYPEEAPYQKIIVSAGAVELPDKLVEQLDNNGKIIIPLKTKVEYILTIFTKIKNELLIEKKEVCDFVPLLKEI